ncbi:MAG: hypothetical protein ABR562_10210, partial [Thermoplasmatota archaeon]
MADAGGEADMAPGDVVTLDGSRSSDPDGDVLAFHWEQYLVEGDTVLALSDANVAKPTFTMPDSPAPVRFRLTVSDGKAASQDLAVVFAKPAGADAVPRFTFEVVPGAAG